MCIYDGGTADNSLQEGALFANRQNESGTKTEPLTKSED